MSAPPLLSVIVPVHNGAHLLRDTLGALAASDLARSQWELIVVNDASRDGSAAVAAELADRVLTLPPPARGPGGTRNTGSEAARGEWMVFIDADVRVHHDTLRRFVRAIEEHAGLVAVFGTYDDRPTARGLLSEYRNLLHRYGHLQGVGEAETFWAGCGAVRRSAFVEAGGFDTAKFPRPQIEDIDLGYRLRERGGRILLDPTIQATHLKRWTLMGMLRTDVRDRGIPWMRLLLERRGQAVTTLNATRGEQGKVGLVALGLLLLAVAVAAANPFAAWAGGASLAAWLLWNLPVYRWFAGLRGPAFAVAVVPLHLLYYICNAVSAAIGLVQHLLRTGRSARRGAP